MAYVQESNPDFYGFGPGLDQLSQSLQIIQDPEGYRLNQLRELFIANPQLAQMASTMVSINPKGAGNFFGTKPDMLGGLVQAVQPDIQALAQNEAMKQGLVGDLAGILSMGTELQRRTLEGQDRFGAPEQAAFLGWRADQLKNRLFDSLSGAGITPEMGLGELLPNWFGQMMTTERALIEAGGTAADTGPGSPTWYRTQQALEKDKKRRDYLQGIIEGTHTQMVKGKPKPRKFTEATRKAAIAEFNALNRRMEEEYPEEATFEFGGTQQYYNVPWYFGGRDIPVDRPGSELARFLGMTRGSYPKEGTGGIQERAPGGGTTMQLPGIPDAQESYNLAVRSLRADPRLRNPEYVKRFTESVIFRMWPTNLQQKFLEEFGQAQ